MIVVKPLSMLIHILLGSPRVELAGHPVFIQRRKALALLAYLAVHPSPQRRDTLAALLWPENPKSSARTALSRHCSELKQLLGEQWLVLETATVGIRLTANFWLDVIHFQGTLTQCTEADCDTLPLLTSAVNLYRGDFLSGFSSSDCPDFDDWQASRCVQTGAQQGAICPLFSKPQKGKELPNPTFPL